MAFLGKMYLGATEIDAAYLGAALVYTATETIVVEDATGGIISISTGDGITTVIVTAPTEYAGTYEIDGADFASGPVILKAPVIIEPPEVLVDTVLDVTPALIAWDNANGDMTAVYRIARDGTVGETISDLEYTVSETDEGVTLAVEVTATDDAGSRSDTSVGVLVPEPDTPTPTEMAISGADNVVSVLAYWTAETRPISGANNEVTATWA